jgi:hypothetical protein
MSWFEKLLGFPEENPDQVRANLVFEGAMLGSKANGERYRCGTLETPSLGELRELTSALRADDRGALVVEELVGDVQQLHQSPGSNGALFQVASQFNLLEMVGPGVTPERGVGIYEHDRTQGPACAIACGAATVMRNYLADVGGQVGQSAERQIDCLRDLGDALGNMDGRLWSMRNGYALASEDGLETVAGILGSLDGVGIDALRGKLRIGVQWQAGVTLGGSFNVVTQAFCSAVPVAYSRLGADLWEPLARLVLDASYEATFHAALLNRERTGSSQLLLTLLGGGAFGNRIGWIIAAIQRSLALMRRSGLEVKIVSYGSPTPEVQGLVGGG